MPNIKMSEMTPATSFSGNSIIPLVSSGVNKNITASLFFRNIKDDVVVNADGSSVTFEVKAQGGSSAFYVSTSDGNVGVNTSSPAYDLHVVGSMATVGPTYDKSIQTQAVSGAVDLSTSTTIVDSVSSTTLQLAPGSAHQIKNIYRKGSGSLVINAAGGSSFAGGTSLTFNAQGSSVQLHFVDGFWYIRSAWNVTLA